MTLSFHCTHRHTLVQEYFNCYCFPKASRLYLLCLNRFIQFKLCLYESLNDPYFYLSSIVINAISPSFQLKTEHSNASKFERDFTLEQKLHVDLKERYENLKQEKAEIQEELMNSKVTLHRMKEETNDHVKSLNSKIKRLVWISMAVFNERLKLAFSLEIVKKFFWKTAGVVEISVFVKTSRYPVQSLF